MKYIIFNDNSVVLFSNCDDHKAMSGGRPVLSAGFCTFETGRTQFDDIYCKRVGVYGRSVSLGVESRPEDGDIIKRAIGKME